MLVDRNCNKTIINQLLVQNSCASTSASEHVHDAFGTEYYNFSRIFLIFQDEIFHRASLPVTLFLFRCYQRISSGQAVEWNMEFRGKRQYKRYLTNPDIPVPRTTAWRKKFMWECKRRKKQNLSRRYRFIIYSFSFSHGLLKRVSRNTAPAPNIADNLLTFDIVQ